MGVIVDPRVTKICRGMRRGSHFELLTFFGAETHTFVVLFDKDCASLFFNDAKSFT